MKMCLTQHLFLSAAKVAPVGKNEWSSPGGKTNSGHFRNLKVRAVLYFKPRLDPNDGQEKFSARYAQGLDGRKGLMVFWHRDVPRPPKPSLRMVEFPVWGKARFALAMPTKEKRQLTVLIRDLKQQLRAAEHLPDQETTVDQADIVSFSVVKFTMKQKGPQDESKLKTEFGLGIGSDGQGIETLPDWDANPPIRPGWCLVKIGINHNKGYALARPYLDPQTLRDAIADLEKQLLELEQSPSSIK
ncbi:MAG: hypothetical protein C3F02_02385 [Parcubacteria group bacterium]|nr:MAG: hypothetical protein C3F02_02385 [Parcubacteria group bacterium]